MRLVLVDRTEVAEHFDKVFEVHLSTLQNSATKKFGNCVEFSEKLLFSIHFILSTAFFLDTTRDLPLFFGYPIERTNWLDAERQWGVVAQNLINNIFPFPLELFSPHSSLIFKLAMMYSALRGVLIPTESVKEREEKTRWRGADSCPAVFSLAYC